MMGTCRLARLPGISKVLISDADLKAGGNRLFEEYEVTIPKTKETFKVCRWDDSKIFNIISTFGSAYPTGTVERFNKDVTPVTREVVECPGQIALYNANMGGVDKMDALVGFYRTFFRSRKWYHRILFHFMDVALGNAWLLYRRDMISAAPDEPYMGLFQFKLNVSLHLRNQGQPLPSKRSVGRPSLDGHTPVAPRAHSRCTRNKRPSRRKETPEKIRFDQIGHFPDNVGVRKACALKGCTGKTLLFCIKCKLHLCINKRNNCFTIWHGVDKSLLHNP